MSRSFASEPGSEIRAVFVGDARHPEFLDAAQWLRERTECAFLPDVNAAESFLRTAAGLPQLLVLAQPRPDRYSAAELERLHAAAPLARLVSLLGGLCEGELRSGRPWPGVPRIYWHQWRARCEAELLPLVRGERSSWSLPRTATPVEQTLYVSQRAVPVRSGLVVIRTPREVDYEALAEVCARMGTATLWLPPDRPADVQGVDLLLWDSDGRQRHELDRLGALVQETRPNRVLALLGFPRREDVRAARAAGADRVLSKPHMLDDLLACLARLLPTPPARAPQATRRFTA